MYDQHSFFQKCMIGEEEGPRLSFLLLFQRGCREWVLCQISSMGYLFCLVNYLLVWPKMSQVSIMGLKYLLEQYNYFTFSMFCDIQQVEDLWKKIPSQCYLPLTCFMHSFMKLSLQLRWFDDPSQFNQLETTEVSTAQIPYCGMVLVLISSFQLGAM